MTFANLPLTAETTAHSLPSTGWVERRVRSVFEQAGIAIGAGTGATLRVNDPRFYRRLAANPAYELGQTYVDGLWDCEQIDALIAQLLGSGIAQVFEHGWKFRLRSLMARVRNLQSRFRASMVADRHYDLGNELFQAILDPTMTYTCGIWGEGETTLEGAQRAKLEAICRKLPLSQGSRFLDIGCGWGGLVAHAAQNHGVHATGITISRNQETLATERLRHLETARVHRMDYRDLVAWPEPFDNIASVEMIEAVGPKNFERFMQIVHRVMRPGGHFLLQCFISHQSVRVCNEWFDRHIFPNGVSPSLAQLAKASESTFGSPVHIDNIGTHYDPTLMAWDKNLVDNSRALVAQGYAERELRAWHFYLRGLAGVFRAEHLRVYQILYRRHRRGGVP